MNPDKNTSNKYVLDPLELEKRLLQLEKELSRVSPRTPRKYDKVTTKDKRCVIM